MAEYTWIEVQLGQPFFDPGYNAWTAVTESSDSNYEVYYNNADETGGDGVVDYYEGCEYCEVCCNIADEAEGDGVLDFYEGCEYCEAARNTEDSVPVYENPSAVYEDAVLVYENAGTVYEASVASHEDSATSYEDSLAMREYSAAGYEDWTPEELREAQ